MGDSEWSPLRAKSRQMSVQEIIEQWRDDAHGRGLKAYNLGSGQRPVEGYVNVDAADIPEVDVVADLFGSNWPLEDGSAGMIYMSHFLEHVPNWSAFWNEMWRIAADECRVVIHGPWFMSNRHYQDPTHCQPLLDEKFLYLDRQWRTSQLIEHYGADASVNFVQMFDPFRDWSARLKGATREAQMDALYHERNAVGDCVWFLKALKSEEAIERMKQSQLKALGL